MTIFKVSIMSKLKAEDSWYYSNLIGIIKTQKSLVESGAQKVIDRKLIMEWTKSKMDKSDHVPNKRSNNNN